MAAGAIGALLVVASGYLVYQAVMGPAPGPAPAPVALPLLAPEAGSSAAGVQSPEPQASPDADPAASATATAPAPDAGPVLPAFDVVRIDPDGAALVAGKAQPGAQVRIVVDGAQVAQADADASGNFVALFTLSPSVVPQVMSLSSGGEGGAVVVSAQNVIVEPAPVMMAQAPVALPGAPAAPVAPVDATRPAMVQPDAAEDATAVPTEPSGQAGLAASPSMPEAEDAVAGLAEPGEAAPGDAAAPEAEEPGSETDADVVAAAAPAAPAPPQAAASPAGDDAPAPQDGAAGEVIAADGEAPSRGLSVAAPQNAAGAGDQGAAAPIAPSTPLASDVTAPATPLTSDATVPATPLAADATEPATPLVTDAPAPATPLASDAPAPATPPEAAPVPETGAALAAPRVLLADGDGIQVLQDGGAGPSAMQSVTIDTIAYDNTGEVRLAGRGRGEATVRIYLDNAPIRTARIAEDGQWRTPLPDVETGVYTLRVDELAEDGTVTSRSETPFKREEPTAIVAAAEVAEPQPGETTPKLRAVTVQPGFTLWAIAEREYGKGELYVRVFNANSDQIRDPHWIYPGQVFSIPEQ